MFHRGAILLILVAIAYVPACQGDFIWDDDAYVSRNEALRSNDGLWRIWFSDRSTPQYYPLVFTTFWLEYRLWGLNPAGYHWVNVILHGLNAVLLWLLLRRLGVPFAWLAAAVFALHPVHVESVAWITERKNVLSGFCYLLAFHAFLRFAPLEKRGARGEGPGASEELTPDSSRHCAGSWGWYAVSFVAFVLALLSKSVTCSLPAVLVLVYWWKRGWPTRREWLALVPMFLVGLVLGLHTSHIERHYVGANGPEWNFSPLERSLIAGRALWFYVGKLLWPYPLIFNYERWHIDVHQPWQYLYPLGCLGVFVVLLLPLTPMSLPRYWAKLRLLGRGPLTACLIFGGTLLPALGFFDVYPMLFYFAADHFQYLASIAMICLGVAGVHLLGERWRWIHGIEGKYLAAAVLVGLGLLTWKQGYVYRDLESLWTDTIAKNPNAWMAHYNLGNLRMEQKNYNLALQCFERMLKIQPRYGRAHNTLAYFFYLRGIEAASAAKIAKADNNFALFKQKSAEANHEFSTGLKHARKALELEGPDDNTIQFRVGWLYCCLDEPIKAIPYLERALEQLKKTSVDMPATLAKYEFSLGQALFLAGRRQEALDHWRAGQREDSSNEEIAKALEDATKSPQNGQGSP